MIKEIGSGAFQRHLSPKQTLHRIIFAKMVISPGHAYIAFYADTFLPFLQGGATHSAKARKKEVDE